MTLLIWIQNDNFILCCLRISKRNLWTGIPAKEVRSASNASSTIHSLEENPILSRTIPYSIKISTPRISKPSRANSDPPREPSNSPSTSYWVSIKGKLNFKTFNKRKWDHLSLSTKEISMLKSGANTRLKAKAKRMKSSWKSKGEK